MARYDFNPDTIYSEGVQLAHKTVKLNIPDLDADASPDSANDYVVSYDASAGAHKKVLIDNLPTGVGGSGEWTDTGTTLHPTETTDDVVIGDTSPVQSSKLSVAGDDDQVQLAVQGNSTQTELLVLAQQSGGTDVMTLDNGGALTVAASIGHTGDSDTLISFASDAISLQAGGITFFTATEVTSGAFPETLVINPDQDNIDLYVHGVGQNNLIHVDGSIDEVHFGHTTSLSAFVSIDGHSASDVQLLVQGAASQSADILVVESSAGTDLLTVSPSQIDSSVGIAVPDSIQVFFGSSKDASLYHDATDFNVHAVNGDILFYVDDKQEMQLTSDELEFLTGGTNVSIDWSTSAVMFFKIGGTIEMGLGSTGLDIADTCRAESVSVDGDAGGSNGTVTFVYNKLSQFKFAATLGNVPSGYATAQDSWLVFYYDTTEFAVPAWTA